MRLFTAGRLAVMAIATLVIASGLYWQQRGPATPAFSSAMVEVADIEDSITALGTLEPLNYVDVGTQVSGQLLRLHVEPGDQVEAGQLLAEIDPTLYQTRVEASTAQLATQRAQLQDREAQLQLARLQAERQRRLMTDQATSQEAVEVAEANLRSASAQVDVLKAQIRQTESTLRADQADLGFTRIHAPMTGTVVQQLANQGQTLNANQTAPLIVQIADLSSMTVRAQVSEADIARLSPGMPVWFTTLGRPDVRYEGRLRQILPTPEVINNVVLFNALFDVDNPRGELLPKMSAQVFFVRASASQVPSIPIAALQPANGRRGESAGHYQVRVLDNQGQPVSRSVRIGVRNRVHAEVLEGLQPGERVITGSASPANGNNSGTARGPRF